jgi:hypothetical protein
MNPTRDAGRAGRPGRCPGYAGLVALALFVLAAPAGASWTLGQVGSWMIVERWDHGLGPKKATRVTTTLLNRDRSRFWFEHINDQGQRWEDADSGSVGLWTGSWTGGGSDTFLGRDSLRIDGKWVRCRMLLNVSRSKPFAASDPVKQWVSRSKRWEAVDTTLRVRVVKSLDLGTETQYRDGRVEKHAGRVQHVVKSLHERVRIHGRSYDCWVQEWKSLDEKGDFAGRTTVWGCETTPAGWVRQLSETREADKSGVTRSQQQLVDFKFN